MDTKTISRIGLCFGREERRRAARVVRKSRLKPDQLVFTGTGRINRIVKATKDEVHLVTREGGPAIVFPISAIVSATAYLFRARIVERKELEVFHKFNSCLMAILRAIFKNQAKVVKWNRILRLFLKGIRFFFAGADKCSRDLNIAAGAGAKYVLMSYHWLRQAKTERWKDHLKKNGMKLLLDSGAFSVWAAKKNGRPVEDIDLDKYVDFIKKHQDIIEGAIVLDVVGDYKATKENLRAMEEKSPVPPIPVFHLGTPISELRELVESGKYPVIALGGTVNHSKKARHEFLAEVFSNFPNYPFHGLGISDIELLLAYNFFSCDSSAWQQGRIKNVRFTRRGQIKGPQDAPLSERLMTMFNNVKFLAAMEDHDALLSLRWPAQEQMTLAL